MKNTILSTILCCLVANCLFGQSVTDVLKRNAVSLGNLDNLSDEVYGLIKPFDLLMIGEMHGTNEPANFAYALAQKIVKKEGTVCVGIEVPQNKVNLVQHDINEKTLLNTTFFKEDNIDGRNGVAWFDLILNCASSNNIKLFFMDNDTTPSREFRDSIMYLEVKAMRVKHPNTKIITLTGNIHNWLVPFRGSRKMGTFIATDTTSFDKTKIMSMNHIYNEGTMLNNTGNGLELKKIEAKKNIYTTTLSYENYLCQTIIEAQGQYNYFFYTTKVSHSRRITER